MLPCAAYLNGEYGVKGLYVGVPCIIGAKGVEKVVEINLNQEERAQFMKSVNAVRNLVAITKKLRRKSAKSKAAAVTRTSVKLKSKPCNPINSAKSVMSTIAAR